MPIQFDCPACGKRTQAPDEMAGRSARCPLCKEVIEVPLPAYGAGASPAAAAPTPPKKDPDEGRKPCPMCGEMILEDAAKCRFCGEILDEELRKTQKKSSPADSDLSAGEYVIAILCAGIGCIMGIVWMIQGKPKGLKMFLISIAAAVIWNVLSLILRGGAGGH
jgi:predicted RNA-binding Zn-ribbon protein involved in translation (DUF1610 family)